MALGKRQGEKQQEMFVAATQMQRSPGHPPLFSLMLACQIVAQDVNPWSHSPPPLIAGFGGQATGVDSALNPDVYDDIQAGIQVLDAALSTNSAELVWQRIGHFEVADDQSVVDGLRRVRRPVARLRVGNQLVNEEPGRQAERR